MKTAISMKTALMGATVGLVLFGAFSLPAHAEAAATQFYRYDMMGNRYYQTMRLSSHDEIEARSSIAYALSVIADRIDDLRGRNSSDVEDALDLVTDALSAYHAHDYDEAIQLAYEAQLEVDGAYTTSSNSNRRYGSDREDSTRKILDDVEDRVDAARNDIDDAYDDGDDVREARRLLNRAQAKLDDAWDAFNDEDWSDARELANDADDLADDAVDAIDERSSSRSADVEDRLENAWDDFNDAWDDVNDALNDDDRIGNADDYLDDAEDYLRDAEDELDDDDYSAALSLIKKAEARIDDARDEL